jgi:hypothetical protein
MSRFARVTSIDVLQTVAGALQRFRSDSNMTLDELDMSVRRALEWIHHDRKDHWDRELRRSEEAVTQARLALRQAKMSRRIDDHEPECVDEQRALERAKRRYDTAQRKVAAVKHWARAIEHAVDEYQRDRIQFLLWAEGDLGKAMAALGRMGASLESYVSLEAPTVDTEKLLGEDSPPASGEGKETNL